MSQGDERTATLKSLYRYALRFNGNGAEQVFAQLLEQAKSYRPEIHADLKQYDAVFRSTYMEWRNQLYVYDAHHDWISAIVELARYLSDGWSGYRTIMERYLSGAVGKAALLDEEMRNVLRRLSQWLAEEADGPRVELIYE